jgi:hypothetical protein
VNILLDNFSENPSKPDQSMKRNQNCSIAHI